MSNNIFEQVGPLDKSLLVLDTEEYLNCLRDILRGASQNPRFPEMSPSRTALQAIAIVDEVDRLLAEKQLKALQQEQELLQQKG